MSINNYPITRPQSHTVKVWDLPAPDQTETPKQAYDRWAGEIGVSSVGTDIVVNADTAFSVDIGQSFYDDYGLPAALDIHGWGNIAFYDTDVSALGVATINDGFNNVYGIRSTRSPIFVFAPIIIEHIIANVRIDFAQIRTAGNRTIIYWKASDLGSASNAMYVAVKIESGVIEVVARPGTFGTFKVFFGIFPDPDVSTPSLSTSIDTIVAGETKSYTIALQRNKLDGTITETVNANKFKVHLSEILTGTKVGSALVNTAVNPNFSIEFAQRHVMNMTVTVDAYEWEAGKAYGVGDIIYPTDAVAAPYYYKATVAGTSGSVEPTWVTTPIGNTQSDGGVTWELSERLVQPVTHGPLKPVAIP